MGNISDEILMAYADGELAGNDRKMVAKAIAGDLAIKSRLDVFIRTREQLSGLFDEPMRQPIPDKIMHLFGDSNSSATATKHAAGFAGAESPTASAAGLESLASPAGLESLASPAGLENLASPAGLENLASPAGLENLASPAGRGSAPEAWQSKRRGSNSIADLLGRWLPSGGSAFAAAATMGLALVTGAILGWQLRQPNPPAASHGQQFVSLMDGRLVAGGNFSDALSHTAMGRQRVWQTANGDKLTLKPLSTFRTTGHGLCRQYQLTASSGASFAGVACRSGRSWQIPLHVASRSQAISGQAASGNAIAPAAGPGNPVIDNFVDQLIDGDVLDPADEAALIKGGWTKKN